MDIHLTATRCLDQSRANSRAVAEATLMLMLSVLRQLVTLDAATRQGCGWSLPPDATDRVGELCGSTVGLIGFGAVPQLLVNMLQGLGANVQFWSRSPVNEAPVPQVDWQSLLQTSDIVSLHVPLTRETQHLIDSAALAAMKPSAHLINVARGPVADEKALIEALQSKGIAAVGLDVTDEEPLPAESPLWTMPNVLITPHTAGETQRYEDSVIDILLENLDRLWRGETELRNQVV